MVSVRLMLPGAVQHGAMKPDCSPEKKVGVKDSILCGVLFWRRRSPSTVSTASIGDAS